MSDPIDGKYFLLQADERLNTVLSDSWQRLDSETLKTCSSPNIYVMSAHGKLYIGSTARTSRPREHVRAFQRGVHRNRYMQAVANKHGIGIFLYQVVTVIPPDLLPYRAHIENAYVKLFDTYRNGYNLQEFSTCYTGRKRGSSSLRRFIDPMGNVIETANLTDYCHKHGLDYSALIHVSKGNRVWRGYRGYDEKEIGKPYQYRRPPQRSYRVSDSVGRVLVIEDLKAFCREHGLAYQAFWHMAKGKGRTSQGYAYAGCSISASIS